MFQKMSGKVGSIAASILPSVTYNYAPQSVALTPNTIAPTNVLEIDWANDEYTITGGGIINHIAPVLYYQQWRGSSSNKREGIITIHAVGGNITVNTRNEVTNKWGNILTATTILSGTSAQFEVDSENILSNSADTIPTTVVGVTTTSTTVNGYLADGLCRRAPATITIGSVVGVSDSAGNITGSGINNGYFDYGSGHFEILLTVAPTNGTNISVQYTKINSWRASGTWSLV